MAGLYPSNPVEGALADEVLDSVEDLIGVTIPALFGAKDEDDKKAKCAELVKEGGAVRYWLDKFVNRLEENEKRGNKNGFFVGDTITIADLKAYSSFSGVETRFPGGDSKTGLLSDEKYKPILKFIEAVSSNEKVKAFKEQFEKNMAAFKEKPDQPVFKYAGKTVPGSL